jgi:Zn-dependent protease with chaperone function
MLFFSLCLTVALLSWAITAALVTLSWPRLRPLITALNPSLGADCLFLLELLPALSTAGLLALFVVPAFSAWEPSQSSEHVNVWMAAATIVVLGLLWHTLRRLYLETRGRLLIDADAPFVAVLGCLRQKVVVTPATRALLSQEELQAVLQHERSHVRRRDNVRLLAARFTALLTLDARCWREMESERARMTEFVADSSAANDESSALDLAQALVKIAKHFPTSNYRFASTLAGDAGTVQERVLRLLQGTSPKSLLTSGHLFVAISVVLAVVLSAALHYDLQFLCYQMLEKLVSL